MKAKALGPALAFKDQGALLLFLEQSTSVSTEPCSTQLRVILNLGNHITPALENLFLCFRGEGRKSEHSQKSACPAFWGHMGC